MKKVIIVLIILLISSLQAMEENQSKVLSLREQAAKKLAATGFSDYQNLPDQTTRELLFKYRNSEKLNIEDLKKYLSIENDMTSDFALYLAPLLAKIIFEENFASIVELLKQQPDIIQNILKNAFLKMYKNNGESQQEIVTLSIKIGKGKTIPVVIPLDLYMFKTRLSWREILPFEYMLALVWIQQIEKAIAAIIDNYKKDTLNKGEAANIEHILQSLKDFVLKLSSSTNETELTKKELQEKLEVLTQLILFLQDKDSDVKYLTFPN